MPQPEKKPGHKNLQELAQSIIDAPFGRKEWAGQRDELAELLLFNIRVRKDDIIPHDEVDETVSAVITAATCLWSHLPTTICKFALDCTDEDGLASILDELDEPWTIWQIGDDKDTYRVTIAGIYDAIARLDSKGFAAICDTLSLSTLFAIEIPHNLRLIWRSDIGFILEGQSVESEDENIDDNE